MNHPRLFTDDELLEAALGGALDVVRRLSARTNCAGRQNLASLLEALKQEVREANLGGVWP